MFYGPGAYGYEPCCSYAYPAFYGTGCGYGYRGGFALIVVLFILLIIIGACFVNK